MARDIVLILISFGKGVSDTEFPVVNFSNGWYGKMCVH